MLTLENNSSICQNGIHINSLYLLHEKLRWRGRVMNHLQNGKTFFYLELEWMKEIIQKQLDSFRENNPADISENHIPNPPGITAASSKYEEFVMHHNFSPAERFILILALCPHINPGFLDKIIAEKLNQQGEFPQLGGIRGKNFRGFLPTVETALFCLTGENLSKRFEYLSVFSSEHLFHQKQILHLEPSSDHEPFTSSQLVLDHEYVELFTLEKVSKPRFSASFPAQLISTKQEWEDLVLNDYTLTQIKEIETWIKYNDTLLYEWGMHKKIKPGFRCLFHGPAGTGKTLTATLLGKYTGRDVFRIDLSTVISKFIGETEKNLARLFDKAQTKDWILFFDEADALFGKRTNVRDAHDKYANQEVSYLLQRIEDFPGLVILASNFKSNIDEAFTRRFQSIIHFPLPKTKERVLLWEKSIPVNIPVSNDVDLEILANQHELTGANIINIIQYASLQTLADQDKEISLHHIHEGIKKEYYKEGKIL